MTPSFSRTFATVALAYGAGLLGLATFGSLGAFHCVVIACLLFAGYTHPELRSRTARLYIILAIAALVAEVIYYAYHLEIIAGPDERRYFDGFFSFAQHPYQFIADAFSQLIDSRFILTGSYNVYGLILFPLYWLSGDYRPELSVLANMSLILFAVLYARRLMSDPRGALALFAFAVSPQLVYHAGIFAKDVLVLFLICASFYLLVRRRWIAACALLAMATSMRPYSIAVLYIFYASLYLSPRYMYAAAAASIFICLYFVGVEALVNIPITAAYLVVSPNPFEFTVERPDYLPLYIEAWILFAVFFMRALSSMRSRRLLTRMSIFLSGLLVYSAVMTLLGSYGADAYDFDYQAGSLAGNVVRKKLMVAPLIYLFLFWLLSPKAIRLPEAWRLK